MSHSPVVFGDPESLLIDYLQDAFAERDESYKPATISPHFPSTMLTTETHVQVELEVGGVDDYPVTERAQVRINCWAGPGKRTNVKALASLTMALATGLNDVAGIAGVFVRTGRSDVITDPDTDLLMCWFLVRVDLKATLLAS